MVAMCQKGIGAIKQQDGIKSFEVNSVEENGDNAVVKCTIVYGNGESVDNPISTKKIDGKWYISATK